LVLQLGLGSREHGLHLRALMDMDVGVALAFAGVGW
jgi:hypothetical protein